MEKMFENFQGQVLDEAPSNFEMSGYDDRDMMFIKCVAINEGVNANNALFERADLHKAKNTFVGKPLRIRFVNNNPTGHGYNRTTGRFDEIVKEIGFIYNVEAQVLKPNGDVDYVYDLSDDVPDGEYRLVVYMAMWQDYYPEIASRLRELHSEGDLKFSIEASREFTMTDEGYRKCYNILFKGLAVVKNPAFEKAKSMMVAELLKEGGKEMDFEKLYKDEKAKNEELAGKLTLSEDKLENSESKREELAESLSSTKEELAEVQGTLKELSAERDSLKEEKELAEKQKVGKERMTKLSKYGEVAKTQDELAELSKDEFADVLVEAVDSYKPSAEDLEKANSDETISAVPHEKIGKANKRNRKEILLSMVEGLSK